ncbi:TetR/AcrR family transcriptional regulator [Halorubrum sp. Boch-26]|uniref:TetR/AcrR family transcriptional regulator n=1 Tax=Halorubrum sp. Boch-26 TaxID=2994426 RepID=UPI00246857DD|nr:TetR/AcrR family transcriptional regulator [Halorubrum sp. Boch-26]
MSGFSEEERERIRAELVAAGRELFERFGFERTRVKDVTEAVGIGTSTFYRFFDSKEALYVEVLRAEREALEARIAEAVADVDTPREEVRALLRTTFREVRTNPLISTLIVDGELRALQDRLADADGSVASIGPAARDSELPFAERWAALDAFRYDDPELVNELFYALVFVARSQNAPIGAKDDAAYERVEAALIETIVDGLFADA